MTWCVRRPVYQANYETESGPSLIDGAHLVVNQARGQPEFTDIIFVKVGLEAGGLLGPRNPQTAIDGEGRRSLGEGVLEVLAGEAEEDDDVEGGLPGQSGEDGSFCGHFGDGGIGGSRGVERSDAVTGFDAELL